MQTTRVNKTAVSRTPPDRAGTMWLVQTFTGVLLVVLLLLHMVAHHFVVEGGLRSFADVVAYVSNPLIFSLEVTFLLVVTIHAMAGLRAILLDLSFGQRHKETVNWLLGIAGAAIILYGIWLAVAIQNL